MCGIVGFISKEKNKKEIIEKMADRLKHRGPDAKGYYIDNVIALGHRRLSIIDLKSGNQPLFNESKDIVIVFNGEIYNYLELKEELEKKNHHFKTKSDTEVLIHGYEEWGIDLPKYLRGMFAFAIWDKKQEYLFCARDNFGIKPFYYYKEKGIFMFASEIKAFLEHPSFKKELNKELLGPYLTFGFTPTTETFFKGVNRLNPGSYLIFHHNVLEIKKYYEIEFREQEELLNSTVEKISDVLKESVNRHLISDVPVGSFLSSGIDSSYITSLAKPPKTYTIGYQEAKYSEIAYAKDLAANLKIENISETISKEEYLKIVPKIMYFMDEPFSDAASIALYFLSKRASKDVKVVLSGEGADEFFGGYNTYKDTINLKLYQKIPFGIRHFIANALEHLPEFKGRNFLVRHGTKIETEYIGINRIFSDKECFQVLASPNYISNQKITAPIFEQFENKDDLTKMQAIDINFWLVKDILHKADRMTMANSLELRVPFIDKEVFKVASTLKKEYKVTKENTKIALRLAAQKIIPNESYKKKKLGFPVPLREWIKSPSYYNEIKTTFLTNYATSFFNKNYLLKLLNKSQKDKHNTYKKVWAIYTFLKWYEVYFLDKTFEI